jgi:hypothetical protein
VGRPRAMRSAERRLLLCLSCRNPAQHAGSDTQSNRLTPSPAKPLSCARAAAEEKEELLLPRAARLKPEQREALGLASDSGSDSDNDDEEGGGGHGGRAGGAAAARRKRAAGRKAAGAVKKQLHAGGGGGGEPGPPIEGAALRVDEWQLDVDEEGRLLQVIWRDLVWFRYDMPVLQRATGFLFNTPQTPPTPQHPTGGHPRTGRRQARGVPRPHHGGPHHQPPRRRRLPARRQALWARGAAPRDRCRGESGLGGWRWRRSERADLYLFLRHLFQLDCCLLY